MIRRVRLVVERQRARVTGLSPRWKVAALVAMAVVLLPPPVLLAALVHHVYYDRSDLPGLDAFIRFQPPAIGEVKDTHGRVLIELAREYRRVVAFDDVPLIVRQAILSAEDKNFFSHRGVEYGAWPRIVERAAAHSFAAWWRGSPGPRVRLPQGGSTLTQQLVRGYFLGDQTERENGGALIGHGLCLRLVSALIGVPAANKLQRKVEEIRLSLWLEAEMRRRYGSQLEAKREIFARYASFIYMGHSRYGLSAASEFYFGKPLSSYTESDAGLAALLAGIPKSPNDYAPSANDPRPKRRRDQILALMVRNGFIGAGAEARSRREPVLASPPRTLETVAPAVIAGVFDELKQRGEGRFTIDDLVLGRIAVKATVDASVQTIVNEALEKGLGRYEKRHPSSAGLIQGSVVVLRNSDAAILAEAGGRQIYGSRASRYSDLNRATGSLRQAGSVWKPLVYLTAFDHGLDLESMAPDDPIGVPTGQGATKWISNYDGQFKGPIPLRQALAESRNSVAVWLTVEVGLENTIRTARSLGIRSPIQPYITTALGASEVRLVDVADVYRAIASGLLAEPHVIDRVTDDAGNPLFERSRTVRDIGTAGVSLEALLQVQEGLRGVVRLPGGTAHSLDGRDFPIPVMGKTGTTSDFRDALFVGSTWGPDGITVAVRIGFDDNRTLGGGETGGRAAMPIFREIMLRVYKDRLVGPLPRFPRRIEEGIDAYLQRTPAPETETPARTLAVAFGEPR